MHPIHRLALVAVAVLGGVACESTVTGNEGNFQFSYPADDRVFDFNKPIAIGARLDVSVRDAGDRGAVTLDDARSDDDAILMVESFADDTFTLLATGDGSAGITVAGTASNGEQQTDTVNMLARTPEVHMLRHTCTDTSTAAYLAGQQVYVPFEYTMADGQPVIGYGYYPVTPSSTALTFDATFQGNQYMRFDTAQAGNVTLASDITDAALELRIVESASITGVQEPIAFVVEDIDVGDVNPFYVRPMVDDTVVCQARTPYTVTSDSPEICAVRVADPVGTPENASDFANELAWFDVEGLAAGSCAYTVTFPEGADGAGVSASFTFPIEP
jgi:hypothetical protein